MLSEDMYATAKLHPFELRRVLANRHLLNVAKNHGRQALVLLVVSSVLLAGAYLLGRSNTHGWSDTLGAIFGIVGACGWVSVLMSVGSFVKYAIDCRNYWEAVCAAAAKSKSYDEFLVALRERCLFKDSTARTSRPLHFNKASGAAALAAICAGFLLALAGQDRVGANTGQLIVFPLFCGLLLGVPAYLIAAFYFNKYT